jgi:hypothetical protein
MLMHLDQRGEPPTIDTNQFKPEQQTTAFKMSLDFQ